MIRRDHPELSLDPQCRFLSISRSSVYHTPKGESTPNLETRTTSTATGPAGRIFQARQTRSCTTRHWVAKRGLSRFAY